MTQQSNVSMRTIPASGYIAERIERFKNSTVAASIDKSLFIATLADILEVVKGNEELLAWTPFAERRPPEPEDGERRFLEVGFPPSGDEVITSRWLYLFMADAEGDWVMLDDEHPWTIDECAERGMTHWRMVNPIEAPSAPVNEYAHLTDEDLVDEYWAQDPKDGDLSSMRAEILRRMAGDELKKEVDEA